jgi:Protein of unknown function (DUF3136)
LRPKRCCHEPGNLHDRPDDRRIGSQFPLYCKALRILIREEKTLKQNQRSVCWHRLEKLHHCLPPQYKDPNHLSFHLKRELNG